MTSPGVVPLHKTPMRLADGRELIYFDDLPGAERTLYDARDLDPPDPEPQIRYDPILDEWMIIASHRQARTHLPPADECPLCPSQPGRLTEIPSEDYDVVVFENRFPSLSMSAPHVSGDALLERKAGIGRCEVLCFTADHDSSFSQLSPQRLATVGWAWVDRTVELGKLPGIEYVFCFENRGEDIGVTLNHPHGQIYGYPFVPPRVARKLDSAQRYRDRTGGCVFCDVVAHEVASGERIVTTTDNFVAFVPSAPRWPFEVHLYPRDHVADLPALSEAHRNELVELQADVLGRFDRVFDRPMPYISGWVQAPVNGRRDLSHLHLEIFMIRRPP
ncbi:MAG: UDPglucose--hexose-phosphate uridylyltransferase, partial [Frankiaceae bacterium]|nr:UDPglucose--hexose-phosphate uridylyltransferase [Frankiaceae bacterium]